MEGTILWRSGTLKCVNGMSGFKEYAVFLGSHLIVECMVVAQLAFTYPIQDRLPCHIKGGLASISLSTFSSHMLLSASLEAARTRKKMKLGLGVAPFVILCRDRSGTHAHAYMDICKTRATSLLYFP